MDESEFRKIVAAEWNTVPERFQKHVENVALLVEDEPSTQVRNAEGLSANETLLGLYHGVPNTERGSLYGVGETMPDTITLYRLPILEDAKHIQKEDESFTDAVHRAVRETIWHEVGHYFGLGEHPINERESEGTNRFEA